MLCVVIKGTNFKEIFKQIDNLKNEQTLIEIRFDFVDDWDQIAFEKLRKKFPNPMIFTLRTRAQGGEFAGSQVEYVKKIKALAEIKPEYIDIEYSAESSHWIEELHKAHSDIKILLSLHDFEKMPDLPLIYQEMQKNQADLYKFSVMPKSSAEALSLLHFMKINAPKVIAMGMGKYGEVTRVLSPVFGGAFVYCSTSKETQTAPGQVTLTELLNTYNYEYLSPQSNIYALIGDPTDRSISHLSHNTFLHHLERSSVYVKFPVSIMEIPSFLSMAKTVGIKGISVTMPLKEDIIPFLDEIDPFAKKVGAINTIVFQGDRTIGYNTDAKGALDAIDSKISIKGKKMVFIGAGGAVKSVAAEAISRGATVVILNRNQERAVSLAHSMGCNGGGLDQLPKAFETGYDILINATPDPMPIESQWIIPGCVVMDFTTKPKYTTFLTQAKKKNCILVHGYEMFVGQAVGQFRLWFGERVDESQAHQILNKTVLDCLQIEH